MHRVVLVLWCAIALAACGGDDPPSGGADSAVGCGTVCNTLALPASVSKTADAAARPAFTGGTIVDGTYIVTSVVQYASSTPGGTTVQETYRFAGNVVESAVASSEMAETHYCGTFTTAGNMITFDLTCPMTGRITLLYTMSANTFAFQHGSNQNEIAFATR